jgi:hypothetical protein
VKYVWKLSYGLCVITSSQNVICPLVSRADYRRVILRRPFIDLRKVLFSTDLFDQTVRR